MATNDDHFIAELIECIARIKRVGDMQFILIGGGSLILLGSPRTTNDIDIVIPSNVDVHTLYITLEDRGLITNVKGEYRFRDTDNIITLDIATSVLETQHFERLITHTIHVDGVLIPSIDHALAIKIGYFYLRADDAYGEWKRSRDLKDIRFLCIIMIEQSMVTSDDCAANFRYGYYHVLQLRMELRPEDLANLIKVGGRKLILPWAENSLDQQEYYTCFAKPGSDPFTTLIEERWKVQLIHPPWG